MSHNLTFFPPMLMLRAHVYHAFKGHIFEDFVSTGQVFYKSYNKAVSDDCKSALFYSVKCSVSSDSACVFMGSVLPDWKFTRVFVGVLCVATNYVKNFIFLI